MLSFQKCLRGTFVLVLLIAGTTLYGQGQDVNLAIAKTGQSVKHPGGNLSYQIVVTNNDATDAAANVSMSDPLPAGTFFASVTASLGWACTTPAVGVNGTVTCTLPALAAGANGTIDLIVQVDGATPVGTILTNTATVANDVTETDPSDNTSSWLTTITTAASLSSTLVATPNPVGPNDDITYTINVGNEGPSASENAQLVFTAPPTTAFQSFSTPAGWSCNPPSVGTTNTVITCSNASFGPGGDVFTAVMRVDSAAPNASTLVANATVTQSNSDPDPDDNTNSASVTVQWQANLGVDKSGPATVIAGDTFDYTITVQNLGPDPALDATMTDTLGANLTYVSITQPAGWTCGESLGVVTCTNPSLAASATSTFTLTVTVAQISGGSVTNDVSVSTTSADNVLPNDQDSVSSALTTSADLSVTKVGPATAAPGNDIAYTIDVTNAGPSDAQNASLTDTITLPFVSLASPAAWSCSTPIVGATGLINCTISTLASGATASFTLVVNVGDTTPTGTVVSNTATIASDVSDPDVADTSSTASATINAGIPTLSPWMLALFAAILGFVAMKR